MSNGLLLLNEVIKNKYNSLFTDKTDLHLNSWTVVLLHCSICALPLHSQISRIDYSDRNRLVEARSAHELKLSIAVTTNWFMILLEIYYRMVNSEIITLVHLPGNYIIIIIIKKTQGSGQNQLPGHWELARFSRWPVHACIQTYLITCDIVVFLIKLYKSNIFIKLFLLNLSHISVMI